MEACNLAAKFTEFSPQVICRWAEAVYCDFFGTTSNIDDITDESLCEGVSHCLILFTGLLRTGTLMSLQKLHVCGCTRWDSHTANSARGYTLTVMREMTLSSTESSTLQHWLRIITGCSSHPFNLLTFLHLTPLRNQSSESSMMNQHFMLMQVNPTTGVMAQTRLSSKGL